MVPSNFGREKSHYNFLFSTVEVPTLYLFVFRGGAWTEPVLGKLLKSVHVNREDFRVHGPWKFLSGFQKIRFTFVL